MRAFFRPISSALVTMLAIFAPVCAVAGGIGGGGCGPGSSSPATGASVPQNPLVPAYRTFYVIVDGGEPNFQTFTTILTAGRLGNAFFASHTGPPPFYFVAAPGWTQDTFAAACKTDRNIVGAVIIRSATFFTDAFWIAYYAETEHATPTFLYASCWKGIGTQLAPSVTVQTLKSSPQVTVPLGPLTGLSVLFSKPGNTNGTYQVGYGALALVTALGTLNGNVGVYNPGNEAQALANDVSLEAVAITQRLCPKLVVSDITGPGYPGTLSSRITEVQDELSRQRNHSYDLLGSFSDANFNQLDQTAWLPTPPPSPSPSRMAHPPVPPPPLAAPSAATQIPALPLETMCGMLEQANAGQKAQP